MEASHSCPQFYMPLYVGTCTLSFESTNICFVLGFKLVGVVDITWAVCNVHNTCAATRMYDVGIVCLWYWRYAKLLVKYQLLPWAPHAQNWKSKESSLKSSNTTQMGSIIMELSIDPSQVGMSESQLWKPMVCMMTLFQNPIKSPSWWEAKRMMQTAGFLRAFLWNSSPQRITFWGPITL